VATKVVGNNNQVDLLTLPYNPNMAIVRGRAGRCSEGIVSFNMVSFNFLGGFPFGSGTTQMSDLIICRKADIDGTNPFGLQNGYQINADLISRIRTLKPAYIRVMDLLACINSTATNYTYRPRPTNAVYGATGWVKDYWAGGSRASGAITNNGSDAYACTNPTASGGGAYVDGEVVQGQIVGANTTGFPTLNVNGRGAAPVYFGNAALQSMIFTGRIAIGDRLRLTFPVLLSITRRQLPA